MSCQNCNGPSNCCYIKAKEIKAFKKKVFNHFILEVIFEMVISISSVVTDIWTLVIYLQKAKWIMATLTFIPVLLPTTVFTNVYLSDENTKYSNSSKERFRKECEEGKIICDECGEADIDGEQDVGNCRTCCRGCCLSLFHKDRNIRKTSLKVVRKYLRRSAKYFFGTLILRAVAWTWYLKALIFGYKAFKYPKRYMRMKTPDSHWGHELLLRLDFLQAALENAPQCVIQLYALMVYTEESKQLGILTLIFSFLDFIRVATSVHWNIEKGPVQAPAELKSSILWKTINMSSWILLYVARCCAIAVIVASSNDWGTIIAFAVFLLHMCLFAKLFSSKKFGVAAQKIFVTAFISLFFLPELDALHVDILIQFYYAILLLENTCFIVPWNGLNFDYCNLLWSINTPPIPQHTTTTVTPGPRNYTQSRYRPPQIMEDSVTTESTSANCFIQPEHVVLVVASFTILGVILRLAAARRTARLQETLTREETSNTMEERIANIYKRKWTTMTMSDLANAFLRMLRKEVLIQDNVTTTTTSTTASLQSKSNPTTDPPILISDELAAHFSASQNFIKKSFSMIVRSSDDTWTLKSRRRSFNENTHSSSKQTIMSKSYPGSPTLRKGKSSEDVSSHENQNSTKSKDVPQIFFVTAFPRNSTKKQFLSVPHSF